MSVTTKRRNAFEVGVRIGAVLDARAGGLGRRRELVEARARVEPAAAPAEEHDEQGDDDPDDAEPADAAADAARDRQAAAASAPAAADVLDAAAARCLAPPHRG